MTDVLVTWSPASGVRTDATKRARRPNLSVCVTAIRRGGATVADRSIVPVRYTSRKTFNGRVFHAIS